MGKPENETSNAKLVYIVTKAVNTLFFKIGQELTPHDVRVAIAPSGIQVTIEGEKKRK